MTTPQQVNIDRSNMFILVAQFLELVQQRGKYSFAEAFNLKNALDDVIGNTEKAELTSRDLMLQGLKLGQERGAFTLQDASNIHKLLEFIEHENNANSQSLKEIANKDMGASTSQTPATEEDETISIGDEID